MRKINKKVFIPNFIFALSTVLFTYLYSKNIVGISVPIIAILCLISETFRIFIIMRKQK
jgi:hypothetical protein